MSDRPSMFRPAESGFTLTEMLVVMCVMICLMGFLFPIIGRSMEQSQAAQCQSNLKQLAWGCAAYSADNGGLLPWANWSAVETSGQAGWLYVAPLPTPATPSLIHDGSLWPYLRNPRAYRCPGDRPPWKLGPAQTLTSYIMNGAVCGYGARSISYPLWQMYPAGVMFWESAGGFKGGSAFANEAETQRHGDRGANVVCFDGHAELVTRSQWLTLAAKSPGRFWCNPKTKNGR